MLSAWIAERGQHCTIKIGFWEDNGRDEPLGWGIFLSDTLRHIANAYEERYGHDAADSIAKMLDHMHKELADPSSPAVGSFSAGDD